MRTNAPAFGKRTPFTREHFAEFEKAFGDDPLGKSRRKDVGEAGRFRRFTREEIAKRGENLDISWLKDEGHTNAEDLPEPEEIAAELLANLQGAIAEIEAIQVSLGSDSR
jgi:type I restriction enzyme M protein